MARSTWITFATGLGASLVLTAAPATSQAAVVPVFTYHFPTSSSNLATTTTITDQSGAGNNGVASAYENPGLTSNVPTGFFGQSVDASSSASHIIKTSNFGLLTNTAIGTNGGFSEDIWIYPITLPATGQVSKIFDNGGYDNLRISSTGVVAFRFNDDPSTDVTGSAVSLNTWHHLIFTLNTTGNTVTANAAPGTASLYIDGVLAASGARTKNGNGNGGAIGVGNHPNGGEFFRGYLYDPSVSLGVIPVPEPTSVALIAVGAVGFLARRRRTMA